MDTSKGPTFGTIRLDDIIVDKGFNVRQNFDAEELTLLADSLFEDGQDEPITVNQTGDEEYHLIDGERRYRAAKEADLEEVECKIYQDLDSLTALQKHLRSDIHKTKLSPLEQAIGMRRLTEHGMSIAEVAGFFKVSDDTVRRRLSLLDLPVEIQMMITRQHHALPIRHAEYIATLPTSEALQVAREAAPKMGPVQSEEWVKAKVDTIKNGPRLAGVEPPQRPSRKERRQENQRQAQAQVRKESTAPAATVPGPITPSPASAEHTEPQETREPIDEAKRLAAVDCQVGIVGSLEMSLYGELILTGAMITVRVGDEDSKDVHMFKVSELSVPGLGGNGVAKLVELMEKHQPKATPARKKRTVKKPVKKKK